MTTFTWFGGSGDFMNNANWLPNGVPGVGDEARFQQGTMTINNKNLTGLMNLTIGGNPNHATVLNLENNVVLGKVSFDSTPGGSVPGNQTINVRGHAEFAGPVADVPLSADQLVINLTAGSVLVNKQSLGLVQSSQFGASITVAGDAEATLENDGHIAVQAPSAALTIRPNISGKGTIELGGAPNFNIVNAEFGSAVGPGQTFQFATNGSKVQLRLDKPSAFHGTIAKFSLTDQILLKNTMVTAHSFQNNVLLLKHGNLTVASLRFAPGLALNSFSISQQATDTLIKHA